MGHTITMFNFKTSPRKHQLEILQSTAEMPHFAIFWEMRVGKSKLIIDNAAYLFEQEKINGVLILAPSGVDLNWALDEIPKHLPDDIMKQSRILRFSSSKGGTKWQKAEVKWNREHNGLAWLIMSYDAIMTNDGKEAAMSFLEQRSAFYVLDESVSIKTPKAKRTQRIVRTAHRAKYRRILDGYPSPNGAFDMYSQIAFLDRDFWKRHNWDSFAMFKSYFGEFETQFTSTHEYEKLLGFKNLEKLNQLIAPISSRLLQKDVLDILPKNYEFRYFELTGKQREMYDQLLEEYKIWLSSGELITASMAMVRDLRLQQISCGYIPVGEDEPVHRIEGRNPRLELMESLVENHHSKAIIWARYKLDIQRIAEMLTANKKKFVLYTGDTNDDDMVKAKRDFQLGDAQYFVGTPSKGGIGLTLDAAEDIYYYSNSYNLRHRRQSEERATADGKKKTINVYDLVGLGTRDKGIIKNLCSKMDISDIILGDKPGSDLRTELRKSLDETS